MFVTFAPSAFLGRSPDTATAEDVRRFQVHQREQGAGEAVLAAAVSALRFLFTVTLERPDLSRRLVLAPRPTKLLGPAVVLDRDGGDQRREGAAVDRDPPVGPVLRGKGVALLEPVDTRQARRPRVTGDGLAVQRPGR